jgi:hypothetical protein
MSQQSEECLPESTQAEANSARILHLKARQYDLQRAIQQRAQESVERERALDEEARRPKPLKWLIIATIASIPAVLTLVAVDGFLRAFHGYLDTTVKTEQKRAEEAAAIEEANAAAAAAAEPLQSNEPGVVLLQPLRVPEQAPAQPAAGPSAQQADPAATTKK